MVVSGTAGLWKRSSSLGSGTGRDDSGAELRRTFFRCPSACLFFRFRFHSGSPPNKSLMALNS